MTESKKLTILELTTAIVDMLEAHADELTVDEMKGVIESVYYGLCDGNEDKFKNLINFNYMLKHTKLIKNKPITN